MGACGTCGGTLSEKEPTGSFLAGSVRGGTRALRVRAGRAAGGVKYLRALR